MVGKEGIENSERVEEMKEVWAVPEGVALVAKRGRPKGSIKGERERSASMSKIATLKGLWKRKRTESEEEGEVEMEREQKNREQTNIALEEIRREMKEHGDRMMEVLKLMREDAREEREKLRAEMETLGVNIEENKKEWIKEKDSIEGRLNKLEDERKEKGNAEKGNIDREKERKETEERLKIVIAEGRKKGNEDVGKKLRRWKEKWREG